MGRKRGADSRQLVRAARHQRDPVVLESGSASLEEVTERLRVPSGGLMYQANTSTDVSSYDVACDRKIRSSA